MGLGSPPAAWTDWEAPLNAVHGESHYQESIARAAGGLHHNTEILVVARLIREPTNEHDTNAIRVELDGIHVGYIARDAAEELAPILDRAECPSVDVQGLIRGGFSDPILLGVHLWLRRRLSEGPDLTLSARTAAGLRVAWGATDQSPMNADPNYVQYWALQGSIREAWTDHDFVAVIAGSLQTAAILPSLYERIVARNGAFWSSPPALLHGPSCMAVLGDDAGLETWRTTIAGLGGVDAEWVELLTRAELEARIARSLWTLLHAEGEVRQSDLPKLLEAPGRATAHVCRMAEAAGLITREKAGSTYRIRLTEASDDLPPPPPYGTADSL